MICAGQKECPRTSTTCPRLLLDEACLCHNTARLEKCLCTPGVPPAPAPRDLQKHKRGLALQALPAETRHRFQLGGSRIFRGTWRHGYLLRRGRRFGQASAAGTCVFLCCWTARGMPACWSPFRSTASSPCVRGCACPRAKCASARRTPVPPPPLTLTMHVGAGKSRRSGPVAGAGDPYRTRARIFVPLALKIRSCRNEKHIH